MENTSRNLHFFTLSATKMTGYGLEYRASIHETGRDFALPYHLQTGSRYTWVPMIKQLQSESEDLP
jgi:hypothetical protein